MYLLVFDIVLILRKFRGDLLDFSTGGPSPQLRIYNIMQLKWRRLIGLIQWDVVKDELVYSLVLNHLF